MNTKIKLTLLLSYFSILLGLAHAAPPIPDAPELKATSYLLLDVNSGQILAEKNSDSPTEPASITKLMTIYVALQELKQGHMKETDKATISEKAWRMGGSKMFIEVGKQVAVGDLLKGIIIQSGNDASVALAEHIAGSESTFADMMNNYAEKLGMHNSYFVNSTGWPAEGHQMSARDIATLSTAIIREFPEYYSWFSIKEFTFNGIKQQNRNQLLWRDESVDGLKTGHTEAAGYCLAASAQRNGSRLVSVVMGTDSTKQRTAASQALMTYGFRFFKTLKLYDANEPIADLKLWKGSVEQISVGIQTPLYVTIPRGRQKELSKTITSATALVAPLPLGSAAGKVVITLGGETIGEQKLVTLQEAESGGFWSSVSDSIMLMFN